MPLFRSPERARDPYRHHGALGLQLASALSLMPSSPTRDLQVPKRNQPIHCRARQRLSIAERRIPQRTGNPPRRNPHSLRRWREASVHEQQRQKSPEHRHTQPDHCRNCRFHSHVRTHLISRKSVSSPQSAVWSGQAYKMFIAMTAPAKPISNSETDSSSYIEDFRRAGHEAVDWIANYLATVQNMPVLATTQPGELFDALPAEAPNQGESFQAILRDFDQLVMPAVTQWNHPRFFAYFACTGSTPAIVGEMLAAA